MQLHELGSQPFVASVDVPQLGESWTDLRRKVDKVLRLKLY